MPSGVDGLRGTARELRRGLWPGRSRRRRRRAAASTSVAFVADAPRRCRRCDRSPPSPPAIRQRGQTFRRRGNGSSLDLPVLERARSSSGRVRSCRRSRTLRVHPAARAFVAHGTVSFALGPLRHAIASSILGNTARRQISADCSSIAMTAATITGPALTPHSASLPRT